MEEKRQSLSGVKVVEFAELGAGPYCTKIMADLGAEVIKIEPPDRGDMARHIGPFWKNEPHPEKSGLFIYLNSNKLGITLDPAKPEGKDLFQKLVASTDILVEANLPKRMRELGLTYAALKAVNPRLIMVSVTPFGQNGPYSDYKAYNLNICHGSGESYVLQTLDRAREPLRVGRFADDYDSGLAAGVAALGAYLSRELNGEEGVHLDVSQQEVAISLGRVDQVHYANDGIYISRDIRAVLLGGDIACGDGYVNVIAVQSNQWQGLMEMMGNPEWSRGPEYMDDLNRSAHAEFLTEKIAAWMKDGRKEDIYHEAQKHGVPVTPIYDARDIVNSPQMAAREFFQEFEHRLLGKISLPQGPYRFSETPWTINRPAPALGEHNEEIYCNRLEVSRAEYDQYRQKKII